MKGFAKIGVVCFLRKTFDWESAWEEYNQKLELLKKNENIEFVLYPEPVIEPDDAHKAGDFFASHGLDGLILCSGTFHLGHLTLIIEQKVKKPLYLWTLPEAPYNGGKIRYNSMVGLHLDGANLAKMGVKNFSYSISDTVNSHWIDAIRMLHAMRGLTIGMVGARAQGFYDLAIDELPFLKESGVMLEHYTLDSFYGQEVSDQEIESFKKEFTTVFEDLSEMSENQIYLISKLAASAKKFLDQNNLKVITVRNWPEFGPTYGVSPCAVMSLLQTKGYIIAPEGDTQIALTMYLNQIAGADNPFCADFSQIFDDNTALLWHGGDAPYTLAEGTKSLDTFFAGGRGVTAGFVHKTGDFSTFRIDTALGQTRIFMEKGTALPMEKLLKGTFLKAKFEHDADEVFDTLIMNGLAHHISLVYGDQTETFKIFAKLNNWSLITVNH
ncbi:MAG: fucose isomerase [Brevinema sp.]